MGQAQKAPKAQKAENAKSARLECEAEHSVKEESHAGKAERALFLLAYPLAACYLEYVMSERRMLIPVLVERTTKADVPVEGQAVWGEY